MRAEAKHQELSAEAQVRRHEARHAEDMLLHSASLKSHAEHSARRHHRVAPCTIEMLEHGGCSRKPHVGSHGDALPAPAEAGPRHGRRGRDGRAGGSSRRETVSAPKESSKPASTAAHAKGVVSVPTAGTVMRGWLNDLSGLF